MSLIQILAVDPIVRAKVAPHLAEAQEVEVDGGGNGLTGLIDEGLLTEKRAGTIENATENTSWVEYYVADGKGGLALVHRSAHVTKLVGASASGVAGGF